MWRVGLFYGWAAALVQRAGSASNVAAHCAEQRRRGWASSRRTVLSRHTGFDANITRAILEACRLACAICGTECEAHADMHEHCRICAEACRRCEQACADLLGSLG